MSHRLPVQLPWLGRDVPHGTIEVNQSCNIECDACYKHKARHQKGLELLRAEIDQLRSLRKLGSITLAGGEPCMHPRLAEVIAYIDQCGLRPLLLSNGTLFTPERLAEYRRAGLRRIFLHLDSRQRRRPDQPEADPSEEQLNALRERYIAMGHAAGIQVSPAITLYRDTLPRLPALLDFCFRSPHVDSLLVTNFGPWLNPAPGAVDEGQSAGNPEVLALLQERLGMQPAWFIPSTHDAGKMHWMLYLTAATSSGGGEPALFHFTPRHRAALWLLPRLARLKYGHFPFDDSFSFGDLLFFLALYCLLSLSPRVMARGVAFAARCLRNGNGRVLRFGFQQPPRRLADGTYEACLDCPDATIRNGQLVNLCLVDKLHPLEPEPRQARGAPDRVKSA